MILKEAPQGLGVWLLQCDEQSVGCAGLMPVAGVGELEPRLAGMAEPVVALLPAYWGRGLAVESLRGLMDYARDVLKLQHLAAAADVPNERSHRMLLSCGFQQLSECEGAVYRLRTYQTALQREP